MENKFKPGDKVRFKKLYVTQPYDKGAEFIVDAIDDSSIILDEYDCCISEYDAPNYIELVQETEQSPKKGLRYNSNKLRWRNFPMFLMKPLIEVAQYGEQKYDTYNFLKGQTMSDSLDSLKRHLELLESPYESDIDESGVNHLAHVAWNALVALHMLSVRPDLDDRYAATPEEIELYQKAKEAQKRGR